MNIDTLCQTAAAGRERNNQSLSEWQKCYTRWNGKLMEAEHLLMRIVVEKLADDSVFDCIDSAHTSSDTVAFSVFVKGFTFTDAPELFALLSAIDAVDPELRSSDLPDTSSRMYTTPHFTIFAYLTDDSVCKRIQTGTKRQKVLEYVEREVPEYSFKC